MKLPSSLAPALFLHPVYPDLRHQRGPVQLLDEIVPLPHYLSARSVPAFPAHTVMRAAGELTHALVHLVPEPAERPDFPMHHDPEQHDPVPRQQVPRGGFLLLHETLFELLIELVRHILGLLRLLLKPVLSRLLILLPCRECNAKGQPDPA